MDELVKLVIQKTGLSQDQARKAVDTVVGFLKDKLPEPMASQIDGLLSGQAVPGDIASKAGQALGGLGDLFGGGGAKS